MNKNNIGLHSYLRLDRRYKYKRDAQASTSQREQYGGTVHLFISTGRSLCKFTFMPFIFTIDSWTTQRGLDSLFPFKSVLFPPLSRSSLTRSFGATPAFVSTMLFTSCMVLTRVRRYLFICYTWKTLLNHVFEDLRKTKAPNKDDEPPQVKTLIKGEMKMIKKFKIKDHRTQESTKQFKEITPSTPFLVTSTRG
jgi:hypothetical protein